MGATDGGYQRGNFLRVCDICGHRFHWRDLKPIGEMRWACPDDAPGLTAMQISRWNARARPLKVRPNRFAKGFVQTPTYQLPEAASFNFIAQVAPAAARDGASSAPAAAWAACYMADIVTQNLRPPIWIATAKTVLRTCLDYLLTLQYVASITDPRYGGIKDGTDYVTATTIAAGIAFVKGAAALGDTTLDLAADRVATYLRHVQCGDLQVSAWTTYPSGGGPYHIGGLASGVSNSTQLLTTSYLLADVAALWFLTLLVAVRSPAMVYGDGAATAFFSAPTAAPLSQMLSELGAFAATGARDSTVAGAFVTGLSTTKPQATYGAATNGGAGTGSWTPTATISSEAVALATLGVFQASGMTGQVTAVLAWLAAFAANPANAVPVQRESLTIAGIWGTYNPALCVADNLQASAPFTEAPGAKYSWSSLGLLSPMLSQPGSAGLRTSKDTLSRAQRFSETDVGLIYLGPQGLSGLSLQPAGLTPNVTLAAKGGMIWRQPPGHYPQVALY